MTKTYGYARKEYPFKLVKQLNQLYKYTCDEIFIEDEELITHSEFDKLMKVIRPSDCLIIPSLEVLAKTAFDLMEILLFFQKESIRLICVEGNLDTDKMSSFFKTAQLVVSAEKTRKDYLVKQRKSSTVVDYGRPSISKETIERVKISYFDQKMTLRDVARECDISLGTAHKYVNQLKSEKNLVDNVK